MLELDIPMDGGVKIESDKKQDLTSPIVSSLPTQIKSIYDDYEMFCRTSESDKYEKECVVRGWVRDFRSQADNAFIALYDGSVCESFQLVCSSEKTANFDDLGSLRGGCVQASGKVIKSPASGQTIEMLCHQIIPIGLVNDKNSVLLAKTVKLDTLRGDKKHLRSRFRTFGYIYKIRSTLLKHIHGFFHANNFYNLDPNIVTTSECEGAGEAFTITTLDFNELVLNQKNKILEKSELELKSDETVANAVADAYLSDFFHKKAYLTVSSQLQLEALCAGLSRVYTLNPSFRAEKSKSNRHLASFTHLEYEIAFIGIDELMDFSESLVKYVIRMCLIECASEYAELNKFVSKGIIEKLEKVISIRFERISYDKAIELIHSHKEQILQLYSSALTESDIPIWGDDLGSLCEKYICEYIYAKPVMVYNYPRDLKSFYMKANEDGRTVQAVDCLMPQLGELIGSSIREESYDKLVHRMDSLKMDKDVLQWYLDLRKNSTFPHGGAGLGFDRLVSFCCLMEGNVRDVVPFPVAYEECEY